MKALEGQKDRKRHSESDKIRPGVIAQNQRVVVEFIGSYLAGKRKVESKRGRTQPLLAGFQFRRECTEGLLGGWLAQRQAALREVMAAGALPTFTLGFPCVPVLPRAPSVPEKEISGKLGSIEFGESYVGLDL